MLPRHHPDRIQITFDDRRLVNNAGLILPATLALRLGLPQLTYDRHLELAAGSVGRGISCSKLMTLVPDDLRLSGGDLHRTKSA